MPDFWQFPTVSMGLGPMMAIYQARFMRYLEHRGIVPASDRKVWAFLGDGEMDEPESMGAITMPVREKLDNLVFVINCNLQRLDGPVRGNGKIIQELEAAFLGAGWNVIKVVWGSRWDPLLAQDTKGLLRRLMMECVDGEYQNFKAKGGAYTREHFFGKYPELKEMVANMSDEDIWRLNRGGHDARKVFAAYRGGHRAQGPADRDPRQDRQGLRHGQGRRRPEHHAPAEEARRRGAEASSATASTSRSRTRTSRSVPYYRPAEDSEEMQYLQERRKALGGYLPQRSDRAPPLQVPALEAFEPLLESLGRARDLDDDGVRAHARHPAQGQEDRPARRADRARRGAHLRHGRPVPPDRHLLVGGPALHAAGCRPADVLPRGQEGPDPRGRHQRRRRDVLLDRGRHGLREPRRQHGAVLHLLLDVRLPARRRLQLGGGRHAGARLPDRRHRGPHDAGGRRPAAPGRPQPAASRRRSRTASPTIRPTPTSSP